MKYVFNSSNFNKYLKTGNSRSFEKSYRCCFCGREFKGHGNNPAPLKPAVYECCDRCNQEKVIPARRKKERAVK